MNWYHFTIKMKNKVHLPCWFFLSLLPFFTIQAQEASITYLHPSDRSISYYITHTPKTKAKGLLLLLPGFGETPLSADTETEIPEVAAQEGLLTVIAILSEGPQSFYLDEASQAALDQLIAHLFERFLLAGKKFYMGGFSLGGSGVVKYAERAAANRLLYPPHAIFAIDPPLDLERLYRTQQKDIARNLSPLAVQEAAYFLKRIEEEMGASPDESLLAYHKTSPYSKSDPQQRAAKLLKYQPILLLSEPAPVWQQENRGRNYQDLNTYDCENLIHLLKEAGHQHAFLRLTENKGYRKRSQEYHPHSWSIAAPEATIQWLLNY